MKRVKQEWKRIATGLAVAAFAATAGIAVSSHPASAAGVRGVMDGYTCHGDDVCEPGSASCCFEVIEIPPGQGRCSTVC